MSATTSGRRRGAGSAVLWPMGRATREKAPPVPLGDRMSVVSTSLSVTAMVLVWFIAQVLVLSGLEQGRAQDRLYLEFRSQLAQATAPTGGVIAPGAPVALLSIPALGYEQVVSEGTSSGVLLSGPGHRRDTVLPGQIGVSILYGKSRSFGRPFAPMLSDATGHVMTVTTSQGISHYRISAVRRAGDPMPVAPGLTGSRITMVTSDGQALSPSRVVYVDAEIVGRAFAAPVGRLNAVGPSETAMATDTSVMPVLALSLGALVLVVVGAIVAKQRFGAMRTWIIATPVVLALAWLSSDLAMHLLPNLL